MKRVAYNFNILTSCRYIAVQNSFLLREYARLDERSRELMMCVKLFIKARHIGEAPNGTPSSYCWMNMTVFYLQFVGVVPNLQDVERYGGKRGEVINGLNVDFATAEEAVGETITSEGRSTSW